MEGAFLGDAEWTHGNKEWQETFDLARRFGWTSKVNSSHGGHTLMCPNGSHKIRAYSTGKGADSVARSSRNKITACVHRDFSDPLAQIETALENAGRLLRAAETLIEREIASQEMAEAVELASEQIAEADRYFEIASVKFDATFEIVEDLIRDDPIEHEPHVLATASAILLRKAKLGIRGLPAKHERFQELSGKLSGLKAKLDEISILVSQM